MGETAATVKAYVAQHRLSFLHLLDPDLKAGYRVVAWRQDGLLHALVGALPYARLLELARTCAPRVADAAHSPEAGFMLMETQETHTP